MIEELVRTIVRYPNIQRIELCDYEYDRLIDEMLERASASPWCPKKSDIYGDYVKVMNVWVGPYG